MDFNRVKANQDSEASNGGAQTLGAPSKDYSLLGLCLGPISGNPKSDELAANPLYTPSTAPRLQDLQRYGRYLLKRQPRPWRVELPFDV